MSEYAEIKGIGKVMLMGVFAAAGLVAHSFLSPERDNQLSDNKVLVEHYLGVVKGVCSTAGTGVHIATICNKSFNDVPARAIYPAIIAGGSLDNCVMKSMEQAQRVAIDELRARLLSLSAQYKDAFVIDAKDMRKIKDAISTVIYSIADRDSPIYAECSGLTQQAGMQIQ